MRALWLLSLLMPPLPVYAQNAAAGHADLRYTVAPPLRLSYSVTALLEDDLPRRGRDVTIPDTVRAIFTVDFTPAGEHVAVRVEEQVTGAAESRSGRAGRNSVQEMTIDAKGRRLMAGAGLHASEDSEVILMVPGRLVRQGESWTDTLRQSNNVGTVERIITIVRGTYARDTVVNGRTLNVLTIESAISGETQIEAFGGGTSTMSGTRKDIALWDSERHVMIARESELEMEMTVAASGLTRVQHIRGRFSIRLNE